MKFEEVKERLPDELYNVLSEDINEFRPVQRKAINNGLLEGDNILAATPTASGKTLVGELPAVKNALEKGSKTVYIVPLKALATEKYDDFEEKYGSFCNVTMSIGDRDSEESYLKDYEIIVITSEKLDSLIRHHADWIDDIGTIVIDEIHLMNDTRRGPTLEILITMLRKLVDAQIIGLSATIGNPEKLASWLDAELIIDDWRPVDLKKGVLVDDELEFIE